MEEFKKLKESGKKAYDQGRYDAALKNYSEALQIIEKIGDINEKGSILHNIGSVYQSWGKYDDAIKYYQESLHIHEEIGDINGRAMSLNNIGSVYHSWGKYDEAIKYFQESLKICEEIGELKGKGVTLNNIGLVYHSWGKYDDAIKYFQESLKNCENIEDIYTKGVTLNNIGLVYDSWGKYDEAIKYYQESLQINEEIGDRQGKGATLINIGSVYNSWGKYDEAIKYYQESLKICEEIGDRQGEGVSLSGIGLVYDSLGKYDEAIKYYQESLKICEEIGDRQGICATLCNFGRLERENKNISKALYYHKKALKIARDLKATYNIAVFASEIGKDYKELRSYDKAFKYIEESIDNFRNILLKTPVEHQQQFESKFEDLYDLVAELDDLLNETSTIEPEITKSLHDEIKVIINYIRQRDITDTKFLQRLDSIDEKLHRIEKWTDTTGKFLIDTMGPLKIPVPILIEPVEGGGILSAIKTYFKGKNRDIHFVCAHCGRIHVSKLKNPGKFFAHLNKIAGIFSIVGYVMPWVSGISNIITQAAGKKQNINDLFTDLYGQSTKFKIPTIKKPQKIDLKIELNKITDKPPSISAKENFWDHLDDFNMILCDHGCYKYICRDHQGEDCPFMN